MTHFRSLQVLTALDDAHALPSEFRIFRAGKNESTKGTFVFDGRSAKSVLAEYKAHGIDLMIDYEHASLGVGIDPALSGKAAGWFNLAVRNGELWAVNVRWTPAASNAIRNKEWRFFSPAFDVEKGRIVRITNVAITNLPATRRLTPLIAASIRGSSMTPEQVKKAISAITEQNGDEALNLLQEVIAEAAGGGPLDETEDPILPEAELADKEEDEVAAMAAGAQLSRLTGKRSYGASLDEVARWRASHVELATEKAKLAQERSALESSERDQLATRIALAMSPAVAWEDPLVATDHTKRKPAKAWSAMTVAQLRGFVAKLSPNTSGKPSTQSAGSSSHGLSAREQRIASELKMTEAEYAEVKNNRNKAKG